MPLGPSYLMIGLTNKDLWKLKLLIDFLHGLIIKLLPSWLPLTVSLPQLIGRKNSIYRLFEPYLEWLVIIPLWCWIPVLTPQSPLKCFDLKNGGLSVKVFLILFIKFG